MPMASAQRYVDPAFLARERLEVFGRSWLVVAREQWLQSAGDFLTVNDLGVPLIILRDNAGELRSFVNSCRHRGTKLLDGRGNISAIRCPYHDWKYALDGRLRHVPGAAEFESLERSELGLKPVRTETWAGFVWVCLEPEAPPLRASLNGLEEELAPYRLEEMTAIQEKTWVVPCNWKALLDNATESYHLGPVHGASIDPHVQDAPEFRTYGDHYRLTLDIGDYWWRPFLDSQTARRGPYTEKQKSALHKYVIFPNFLINVLPYHLTVFQVWPINPGSCRFFYGFYKRSGARGLEWLRAVGTWMASRYILLEDLKILERFQEGVTAGADNQHRFGPGEEAIAHFHQVLTRWLSAGKS